MRYLALILVLLVVSCSTKQILNDRPLEYSFMPGYLSMDSVGPKIPSDPSLVVDTSFKDFKSVPVLSGMYYLKSGTKLDSTILPGGVLFSPKKAAYYVFYEAEYQRLKTQLFYTEFLNKTYYTKSLAAEKLYQEEIVRLKKEVKRTWLEKNVVYIGFVSGLATAILTEYAIFQAIK